MSTKLYDISNWCRQGTEVESYPYIGEIDIDLTIGEVVKVDDNYYTIGIMDPKNKIAGVRKVEIDLKPKDINYKSNLTCPYCGYEDNDSWELADDDGEHECGRCGAVMAYERIVTVEYCSSPVKPPEIVTAKWV